MATKHADLTAAINNQTTNSHICGFYQDDDERSEMLAAYYKVGLARKELCVFVTDQSPTLLVKGLKKHDLNIQPALESKNFMILPIRPTYLPDDNFQSVKMLKNLNKFVEFAHDKHYPAVRGGGDMSWISAKPAEWQQVVEYEARINRFIRTNDFTGLCIFKAELFEAEFVQKIIQTHQLIIKGNKLYANPYYVPPEGSFKFDLNLVTEIEKWLDRLDESESLISKA